MNFNALLTAIDFAAKAHGHQVRKNSARLPYITHPISVAKTLAVEGGVSVVATLQAAVLHDTCEDCGTTHAELETLFGKHVADIVAEVSDDKSLSKSTRKKMQIEHAPHMSPEAKTVKLGDKLDNLRSLLTDPPVGWSVQRVQGYFVWAKAVVRGLRGTNAALELLLDSCFDATFSVAGGERFPCIPHGVNEAELLEQYYVMMDSKAD